MSELAGQCGEDGLCLHRVDGLLCIQWSLPSYFCCFGSLGLLFGVFSARAPRSAVTVHEWCPAAISFMELAWCPDPRTLAKAFAEEEIHRAACLWHVL